MSNKMFVRCTFASFLWLLMLLYVCGCEHRPLLSMELPENTFVRVYFDEHIRNVSYGFYDEAKKKPEYYSPQMMRVVFCDEASGRVVTERYLHDSGKDERGYYIQGLLNVPDGRYNMMAYNFDTQYTKIRNQNDYSTMTAYTKPLTSEEANRIFGSRGDVENYEIISKQPDHLFVAKVEGVEVSSDGYKEHPDTIMTEQKTHPVAQTIVKTYYLQISVVGVEYVRSAVALLSGMSGSKTMHDGKMVANDVTSVYFGLNNGKEKNRATNEETLATVAYATFNTFGKLPSEENDLEITFEFNIINNTVQTETFRITDMFDTPEVRDNQWIIIDKVIMIDPPNGEDTGGGMTPGVSDWEEIEGKITI